MLSTKKILSVGVGIASMAGVMAMSTAPVAAAEGTIEVVTHAGAGGGTDVNSRMMMIRTWLSSTSVVAAVLLRCSISRAVRLMATPS